MKRVSYHPDGTKAEEVRFRTDGSYNNADAWKLGKLEARPDVLGSMPQASRSMMAAQSAPALTVNLGEGVSFGAQTLQHSDIEQARGQTVRALADDALIAYAASLLAKVRISKLDGDVASDKIKAGTERETIRAGTDARAIDAKTERILSRAE